MFCEASADPWARTNARAEISTGLVALERRFRWEQCRGLDQRAMRTATTSLLLFKYNLTGDGLQQY